MRKNKTKVIAIVALMIAVVGLGIGFAAFSSQLTISSGATVTPNKSDWNVAFDPTYMGTGFFCMSGNIVSNPTVEGTTISGLEVAFSSPGDPTVLCMFQIKNAGKYRAYLTKVEFAEETLSCEALEEDDENFPEGYTRADDDLVAEACKGISAGVGTSMGEEHHPSVNIVGDTSSEYYDISWIINDIPTDADVLDYSLGTETDGNDTTLLTFSAGYFDESARADGPFIVRIPDIKLTFNTTPTVQ